MVARTEFDVPGTKSNSLGLDADSPCIPPFPHMIIDDGTFTIIWGCPASMHVSLLFDVQWLPFLACSPSQLGRARRTGVLLQWLVLSQSILSKLASALSTHT